jgi:hypothetical protein
MDYIVKMSASDHRAHDTGSLQAAFRKDRVQTRIYGSAACLVPLAMTVWGKLRATGSAVIAGSTRRSGIPESVVPDRPAAAYRDPRLRGGMAVRDVRVG